MEGFQGGLSYSRSPVGSPAREVFGSLDVARAFVVSMLGIRAQRPAAAGKRRARRNDRVRCHAFLHPVNRGREHVEAVKRCLAAAAMAYARDEEVSAPLHDGLR